MSKLLKYREKLNLTQDELAEKAGISVRTIQRIESGAIPKGHTLRTLAEVLNISESELREEISKDENIDFTLVKLINLSSILGILLPPINIIIPYLIMRHKKAINDITKQMISIQIMWTIVASLCFILSPFIGRLLHLQNKLILVVMIVSILVNLFIIIRNSVSLDKRQKLAIQLNFNFI